MQVQKLLTSVELEFIRQLNHLSQPTQPDEPQVLHVDVGKQFGELLSRCAANEQLSLHAHMAKKHLAFDLELDLKDQNGPCLHVKKPHVITSDDQHQVWQHPLSEPIALLNKAHRRSGLSLHTISHDGALITCSEHHHAPKQFNALLPLDDEEPIAITGSLVGSNRPGLHHYWLHAHDPINDERLRGFILAQQLALESKTNSSPAYII